nr:hypothetical protein [Candidatus Woesearchaeota archaeon]
MAKIDYNEEIFERELEEFRLRSIENVEKLVKMPGTPSGIGRHFNYLYFQPPYPVHVKDRLIMEFINNFGSHLPRFKGRGYREREQYKKLQKDLDEIIEELNIPKKMLERDKITGDIFAKLYIEMRKKGYERYELIR